jgi:hypothetical protein
MYIFKDVAELKSQFILGESEQWKMKRDSLNVPYRIKETLALGLRRKFSLSFLPIVFAKNHFDLDNENTKISAKVFTKTYRENFKIKNSDELKFVFFKFTGNKYAKCNIFMSGQFQKHSA